MIGVGVGDLDEQFYKMHPLPASLAGPYRFTRGLDGKRGCSRYVGLCFRQTLRPCLYCNPLRPSETSPVLLLLFPHVWYQESEVVEVEPIQKLNAGHNRKFQMSVPFLVCVDLVELTCMAHAFGSLS